mgnify:CR=1 FL=1
MEQVLHLWRVLNACETRSINSFVRIRALTISAKELIRVNPPCATATHSNLTATAASKQGETSFLGVHLGKVLQVLLDRVDIHFEHLFQLAELDGGDFRRNMKRRCFFLLRIWFTREVLENSDVAGNSREKESRDHRMSVNPVESMVTRTWSRTSMNE